MAWTWTSIPWPWTAAENTPILMQITSRYRKARAAGNIPIPGPTATRCAACVAGRGRRRAGRPAAGVGGNPNVASTTPNAGWSDSAPTRTTTSAERLVRKYHTMGIETLNVAGMIKAGLQSKALADAGMSSLLDQIQYKAQWYGASVIEADQRYPSSRTCSGCGVVNGDTGREREWECPNCGTQHDRNRNAARNLLKLALLAVGEDVTLPDGEALAGDNTVAGETTPDEGRTKPMTTTPRQHQLAL